MTAINTKEELMAERARLSEEVTAQENEALRHRDDCWIEVSKLAHAWSRLEERRSTVFVEYEPFSDTYVQQHAAIKAGTGNQFMKDRLGHTLDEVSRRESQLHALDAEISTIRAKHEAARLDAHHALRELDRVRAVVHSKAAIHAVRGFLFTLPPGLPWDAVAAELRCPVERLIEIRDGEVLK